MNTSPVISMRILAFVALGFTVNEAFDAVLGAGAFQKMAGELFENLRPS